MTGKLLPSIVAAVARLLGLSPLRPAAALQPVYVRVREPRR